MKFYIISIILNVMVLFIPAAYYVSNSSEKKSRQNEPITVNLSESVFQSVSQGTAGNENIGEKNGESGNNESVKNSDDTKKNTGNSEKIKGSKNNEISNSHSESNSKKINNLNDQKESQKTENTKTISQNEQEKEQPKVFSLENKKKDISQAISSISSTSPVKSILSSGNTEKVSQKNENIKVISKEKLTNTVSTSTNISKNISENTAGNGKNNSHIYKVKTNSIAGNENQVDSTNKNDKSDSFVQKVRNSENSGKNGNNRGNINAKVESGGNSKTGNLEKTSKNHDIEQRRNVEKGKGENTNVCNEGKDFTVSYNPNLSYPPAAQRLGNKGVVTVSVRFSFNSSGSVSVISVSGGSSIFQQEARRAASRIRVKIKNPETLKCTISRSFKFELR